MAGGTACRSSWVMAQTLASTLKGEAICLGVVSPRWISWNKDVSVLCGKWFQETPEEGWRNETGEKKKPVEEVSSNWLPLWATGTQSCWGQRMLPCHCDLPASQLSVEGSHVQGHWPSGTFCLLCAWLHKWTQKGRGQGPDASMSPLGNEVSWYM